MGHCQSVFQLLLHYEKMRVQSFQIHVDAIAASYKLYVRTLSIYAILLG